MFIKIKRSGDHAHRINMDHVAMYSEAFADGTHTNFVLVGDGVSFELKIATELVDFAIRRWGEEPSIVLSVEELQEAKDAEDKQLQAAELKSKVENDWLQERLTGFGK